MKNNKAKKQAERLHKSVDVFMLNCVDADGYPMTKAVVPGKYRETINELYFATNTSSNFASSLANNDKASVYFYSKKLLKWQGCYLKGNMEIVTDMKIKEKYWIEKFKDAYAEKTFTDPDFCIIRFIPNNGRYYANFTIEDFEI